MKQKIDKDNKINKDNNIAFTEVGFTSEIGVRMRLWLASL